MGKAYCPKCKKTLNEVFSSFENNWRPENNFEKVYTPGDNCNLVRRCAKCGTLTEKEQKKDYSLLNKPPQYIDPDGENEAVSRQFIGACLQSIL